MGLLRLFFFKHKCLVYTAFGNENFFKVINKLKELGVSYETVTIRNNRFNASFGQNDFTNNDSTQYDIYVREEDKHKAKQTIHR